jgi:hypothetical protein
MEGYPSVIFKRNLGLFSERTQELLDKTFSLVLQVLFFKYKRKRDEYQVTLAIRKRKGKKTKLISNPLWLKEKDISSAISLVDFHIKTCREIDVYSNEDLTKLFGTITLDMALKFYDEFLKKATIKDAMGRTIAFDDNGKLFLYKEHTEEGRHIAIPDNYVESRGKRLSWIKPLLANTKEIYREVESSWETFLYVGVFSMKIDANSITERVDRNHFIVVTRKERGKPLRFITAYYMESQQELLKHLEKASPVTNEQQEYIKLLEKTNLKNSLTSV